MFRVKKVYEVNGQFYRAENTPSGNRIFRNINNYDDVISYRSVLNATKGQGYREKEYAKARGGRPPRPRIPKGPKVKPSLIDAIAYPFDTSAITPEELADIWDGFKQRTRSWEASDFYRDIMERADNTSNSLGISLLASEADHFHYDQGPVTRELGGFFIPPSISGRNSRRLLQVVDYGLMISSLNETVSFVNDILSLNLTPSSRRWLEAVRNELIGGL